MAKSDDEVLDEMLIGSSASLSAHTSDSDAANQSGVDSDSVAAAAVLRSAIEGMIHGDLGWGFAMDISEHLAGEMAAGLWRVLAEDILADMVTYEREFNIYLPEYLSVYLPLYFESYIRQWLLQYFEDADLSEQFSDLQLQSAGWLGVK